jgi:pimeloyl-ACP methyl ester carboxylesterase
VLIHGSSDDGTGTHLLAKALRDTGASVYVPVLRGHHGSGRSGDIDYIGQLEDDLADLVEILRPLHPDPRFTLIGFSAGGGLVLRVIGSPKEKLFDSFVMISPGLPLGAPTLRPGIGGWVSLAMPRIIALVILNHLGIAWFNGLPVVDFATTSRAPNLTGTYSFRLAVDFGAPPDYLAALGRSKKPAALLVGGDDELFYADRFEPLISPVRPDLHVIVVPGVDHVGMTVTPQGIAAVRKSFLALTR